MEAVEWQLSWSAAAESIRKRYEKIGAPIPDHLFPPILPEGYEHHYEAFWELSADRQIGMAAGPIPFTAISEYARRVQIDELDDFWLFAGLIRKMDEVFLKHFAKTEKKK